MRLRALLLFSVFTILGGCAYDVSEPIEDPSAAASELEGGPYVRRPLPEDQPLDFGCQLHGPIHCVEERFYEPRDHIGPGCAWIYVTCYDPCGNEISSRLDRVEEDDLDIDLD